MHLLQLQSKRFLVNSLLKFRRFVWIWRIREVNDFCFVQANLLESLAYICINYTDSVFSPTLHHTAAGSLAHGDHPCVVECKLHRAGAVIIMRISERRRSKNVIYMLNAAAGAYGWRCQWHDAGAESEPSVVVYIVQTVHLCIHFWYTDGSLYINLLFTKNW